MGKGRHINKCTNGKGRHAVYVRVFGKGRQCFHLHHDPLAGWMMASDNLLDLQPLAEVGEYGFSLQGLSAYVVGVAWG